MLANHRNGLLLVAGLFIVAMSVFGCQAPGTDAATTSKTSPPTGGALLWAQSCSRCHNIRQPRARSDAEWDIIMHHMRVRANLTAEDHREILLFLKDAN